MARPTKLSAEITEKICTSLKAGNFRRDACLAAGVGCRTMRDWVTRGMNGEEPFAAFLEAVEEAEAFAVSVAVGSIRSNGDEHDTVTNEGKQIRIAGDWRAMAWWLEHKDPKRWGTQIRLMVDQELDAFLARLKEGLDAETFERVLRIAAGSESDEPASDDGTDPPGQPGNPLAH